jgi:hypothetical protein
MLTLQTAGSELELCDHPDPQRYATRLRLEDGASLMIGIRCISNGMERGSLIVEGGGARMDASASRVVLRPDHALVAVGRHIVCLEMPDLNLKWSQRVDVVTAFAIHPLPGTDDVLVQAELQVTRLRSDGTIVWTYHGQDILTGMVFMEGDHVEISDWDQKRQRVRLSDGAVVKE